MRLNAPFRQPKWSALPLIETPHLAEQVHTEFLQAGADVITTNSYAIVPFHIGDERFDKDAQLLAECAGQLAKNALRHMGRGKVAGSIPPLFFGSYRPDLLEKKSSTKTCHTAYQWTKKSCRHLATRNPKQQHRAYRTHRTPAPRPTNLGVVYP